MDLPDEDTFKRMVKTFVDDAMPRATEDVEKLLNKNRIFIDRTKGIGIMSREEAGCGLSGSRTTVRNSRSRWIAPFPRTVLLSSNIILASAGTAMHRSSSLDCQDPDQH